MYSMYTWLALKLHLTQAIILYDFL